MIRNRVLAAIPYPGVVVTLCLVVTIAVSTWRWGLGVLFPFIQEDLGISRAQIGLIASGAFVGGIPSSLFGGWLADVVGVRRLQTLTMAALFAGIFLFSQAQSFIQAFIFTILIGVTLSTSFPVTAKAIVDWVTPRTRGLGLGIMEAVIPIGAIFAAVLLPFLAEAYSWRLAVRVVAFWIGASGVIFFVFYRNRRDGYIDERGKSRPSGRIAELARNRGHLADRFLWILLHKHKCGPVRLHGPLSEGGPGPVLLWWPGQPGGGHGGSAAGRIVWGRGQRPASTRAASGGPGLRICSVRACGGFADLAAFGRFPGSGVVATILHWGHGHGMDGIMDGSHI